MYNWEPDCYKVFIWFGWEFHRCIEFQFIKNEISPHFCLSLIVGDFMSHHLAVIMLFAFVKKLFTNSWEAGFGLCFFPKLSKIFQVWMGLPVQKVFLFHWVPVSKICIWSFAFSYNNGSGGSGYHGLPVLSRSGSWPNNLRSTSHSFKWGLGEAKKTSLWDGGIPVYPCYLTVWRQQGWLTPMWVCLK